MKSLKITLVAVYIIIIILLLLGLLRCEHRQRGTSPDRDTIVSDENPQIKEKFKADVVMCIDCSGSMTYMINTVKNNAMTFYSDLKHKCIAEGKEITSMRVKVIGFRDLSDIRPFEESSFFDLPSEEKEFRNFVSKLQALGGGIDIPEHSYDALAMAINSSWNTGRDVHHIIILWTDAGSHPLSGKNGVPTTTEELTALWHDKMNAKNKRLILFAPTESTWIMLKQQWDKTTLHDVNAGGGLSDLDYEEILKTLSERI